MASNSHRNDRIPWNPLTAAPRSVRVQALLRRADGPAPESHGPAELADGFELALHENALELAAEMEEAADQLVNSMSAFVPQRRAGGIHRQRPLT